MSLIKLQDKVRLAYEELSKQSPDGGVTPHQLVKYAKPADSPLHKHFEWDNTKAGDKWRLYQARYLMNITMLEVNIDGGSGKTREFRNVKINVDGGTTQRYYDIETIKNSKPLREQVVKDIVERVNGLVEEYKTYREIYRIVNTKKLKEIEASIAKKLQA